MDGFVLHTVMGREGRCRKGREPERRLSETTGPQSPSAFRVVFPAPEVTDRAARCKRAGTFFTRPAFWRRCGVHPFPWRRKSGRTCPPPQQAPVHMFPHCRKRNAEPCAPEPAPRLHAFPRKHAGYACTFPDSNDDGCESVG